MITRTRLQKMIRNGPPEVSFKIQLDYRTHQCRHSAKLKKIMAAFASHVKHKVAHSNVQKEQSDHL